MDNKIAGHSYDVAVSLDNDGYWFEQSFASDAAFSGAVAASNCYGTAGTYGTLGTVGGTAGSFGTLGTYGSFG